MQTADALERIIEALNRMADASERAVVQNARLAAQNHAVHVAMLRRTFSHDLLHPPDLANSDLPKAMTTEEIEAFAKETARLKEIYESALYEEMDRLREERRAKRKAEKEQE